MEAELNFPVHFSKFISFLVYSAAIYWAFLLENQPENSCPNILRDCHLYSLRSAAWDKEGIN